jgi:hypothetical protein
MEGSFGWLPAGYRLDASDPDVWFLRRSDGTTVAVFCPDVATVENMQRAVEADSWSRTAPTFRGGEDADGVHPGRRAGRLRAGREVGRLSAPRRPHRWRTGSVTCDR